VYTAEPVSRATISAVVIHWSPMVRLGIRSAAKTAKCFYVVGDTADADEGMRLVESSRPDIVVMDMQFPTYTGFDLLRDLGNRWPLVRVLIYSGVTVRDFPERCLRAGASGYVGMSESVDTFVRAITRIGQGQIYLSEDCAAAVFSRLKLDERTPFQSPVERLSESELGVLTLVAKGMSNRQIAVAIRKSIKTVETYRSRIKQKVGITSSTALAQFAVTTFTQLRPLRSTDAEAPAENQTDLP